MSEFGQKLRQIREELSRQKGKSQSQLQREKQLREWLEDQKETERKQKLKKLAEQVKPVLEEAKKGLCRVRGKIKFDEERSGSGSGSITLTWNRKSEDEYEQISIFLSVDSSEAYIELPYGQESVGDVIKPVKLDNDDWRSELEKRIFALIQNDLTHVDRTLASSFSIPEGFNPL